ncbi:MAG: hypothetical protein ACE5OZ_01055 [Candidatus Heimdallarchaeota archaeon]
MAKAIAAKFAQKAPNIDIKIHRLGYKDIIYEKRPTWFFWEKTRAKTFNEILMGLKKHEPPVIIMGHSLGGWAADILVKELIANEINQEIGGRMALIQIDALPITENSRILTEKWFGKKIPGIFFNLLLNAFADFLDNINPDFIFKDYLKPKWERNVYPATAVKWHLNFYGGKKAWDLTNDMVHFATGEKVGSIKKADTDVSNANIQDIEIPAAHEDIDKPKHIKIPDDFFQEFLPVDEQKN